MPPRMPSRTLWSEPGAISGVCAIPIGSTPGSIDSSSTPARTTSGAASGGRSRSLCSPIDQATSIDELGQLVDRDELERAFLELSVEQRAALVLTHYVGLSAPEVAAILGIPAGTVHSRLHYGARAMRAVIAGPPGTPSTSPEPGR